MKRRFFVALLVVLIVLLSGCGIFEKNGIENFTEVDCSYGLNRWILPDGRDFLTNYPYESGNYQYWSKDFELNWSEGFGLTTHAKSYVQLFYSEEVYQQAKASCQEYFSFLENTYQYEDFVFCGATIEEGSPEHHVSLPVVRMFGYHDEMRSLVFIAYLNDEESDIQVTQDNFAQFFNDQFGEWFIAQ